MPPTNGPNVIEQAAHIIANFTIIGQMMIAVSIALGIGLFIGGMMQLKRYGEMRTFMSHQMTIWAPLAMIFAGIAMLMLPVFIGTGLLSFWGYVNPMSYQPAGDNIMDQYVPVINMFVRIIGVGAIMRSISLIARSGGHGGQPGTLSRAIFFFFSGILCVHVVGTVHLLKSIFDWA